MRQSLRRRGGTFPANKRCPAADICYSFPRIIRFRILMHGSTVLLGSLQLAHNAKHFGVTCCLRLYTGKRCVRGRYYVGELHWLTAKYRDHNFLRELAVVCSALDSYHNLGSKF